MPSLRAATIRCGYTPGDGRGAGVVDRLRRLHRRAAPSRTALLVDRRENRVRPGPESARGFVDVRLLAQSRRPSPGVLYGRRPRGTARRLEARLDRQPSRAGRLHDRGSLHARDGEAGVRPDGGGRRPPPGLDEPWRPRERPEPSPAGDAGRRPGFAVLSCRPRRGVRDPLPLAQRIDAADRAGPGRHAGGVLLGARGPTGNRAAAGPARARLERTTGPEGGDRAVSGEPAGRTPHASGRPRAARVPPLWALALRHGLAAAGDSQPRRARSAG